MKKIIKPSKTLSRPNYQSLKDDTTNINTDREITQEEEIMGGGDRAGSKKSEIMGKNLDQMINVLHNRLKSLEESAITRMRLCQEDLMPNSKNMSKQAKKLLDDYDEIIPKSLKDSKGSSLVHKDNLVSSDTVYIDAYHLVLKTKATTDTAKKLEMSLEEAFGNPNFRDIKNKKKQGVHTEKSKKTEQLKNEAKRINRQRLEKKLQANMENFVTRSVMDPELLFKAPEDFENEDAVRWPIPVKWSSKDTRSQRLDNNDGEFDPDLILLYSLERINLPSGKNMFTWLVRQAVIQRYFVSLFWIIKIKFFEPESEAINESFLLKSMSADFRRIVTLLAQRAHAEHEKDFAFRYLPFILSNALYFSFYYLCPGSRHIYTKGFKKTIYMQVIQIMHGIQISPMTVKVSWAKLFPEDTHDDSGEAADDGQQPQDSAEIFPLKMALTKPKAIKNFTTTRPESLPSTYHGTLSKTGFGDSHIAGAARGGYLADSNEGGMMDMTNERRLESSGVDKGPTVSFVDTVGGSTSGAEVLGMTAEMLSTSMQSDDDVYIKTTAKDFFLLDFFEEQAHQDPLMRTSLKAPLERPGPKFFVKRQNNIESLNAHQMSPQIQLYLNAKTSSKLSSVLQPLHRTMPVSWCPAGGTVILLL